VSELLRAGRDEPDLLALYDRALPDVYGYLLSRCGSTAVAEDLTAETFLAAVTAVRAGTAVLSVAWLIGIARHKLIDHWRATRQPMLLDDAANDPDNDDEAAPLERFAAPDAARPDVQAMSREQARHFLAAVEALPPAQREAFLLHVDGTLSIAEMAAVTAVGAETLKSRLRYAMKRMRVACADWLEPLPGPDEQRAAIGGLDEA